MKKTFAHILFGLVAISVAFVTMSGSHRDHSEARDFPFSPVRIGEADSLLSTMSLDEQIAQLLVLRTTDSADIRVGGYLLTDVSGLKPWMRTSLADLPTYVGYDMMHPSGSSRTFVHREEWMASSDNPELVNGYARSVARALKARGFNFVLGPSLDLLYNDHNPFTLQHSFSDSTSDVVTYASAFISGLKSVGMVSVVGSYPGLGNVERGYEDGLPVVFSRRDQLIAQDLVPFKAVINEGVQSIIVANAAVPAVDSGALVAASSSQKLHQFLRRDMGFHGLIWADLSATGGSAAAQSEVVQVLQAGSDVVIIDRDAKTAVERIRRAVDAGMISRETIMEKCTRVVHAKLWSAKLAGQSDPKEISDADIALELQERRMVESSLTLLRNTGNLLPLKGLDTLDIRVVCISDEQPDDLSYLVERYAPASVHFIDLDAMEEGLMRVQSDASPANVLVILADAEMLENRKRFGMSEHYQSVIERLSYGQRTVLIWTGNPKAMLFTSGLPTIKGMVAAYENTIWTHDYALQAVFGGRAMTGKTKRRLGNEFDRHAGLTTSKIRLAYGAPEEVGIRRQELEKIDKIAREGMEAKAFPGAQVWFAKDGVVVVDRAYGFHTYDAEIPVHQRDLYDLASITKIAGSTAALMKLTQMNRFSLDHSLCDYLGDYVDTTEYMQMNMREILSHQAGLPAFVPFYSKTLSKGVPRYDVYSMAPSELYPLRVARELYIRKDYPETMFRMVLAQKIADQKKYKYSDVGYYFALRIIERQSGMTMDHFLDSTFYRPMGMATMGYKPLDRFAKERITPTEYDRYFRHQLIHGDVHDPGAAMLGGVGGHAGLFSNANDLGKLMQMFLQGGTYGDQTYFDSSVIADFVRCQFCDNDNRRGAGFDKPLRDGGSGPSCGCTSIEAFGHQGFTGTVTWADPSEGVVYVFLSNRVYPSAENKKLAEMNIRTDIQKVFYQAIQQSRVVADSNL